jgi:RND family efflux transporter MFP subunit
MDITPPRGQEADMRRSPELLLSLGLSCVFLAGCSEEKPAAPTVLRPARVITVAVQKHVFVAQGAGRIQSRYVGQVGFEVSGRLKSRDVDVGAVVKKGQTLAQISSVDYRNKVTAAEAELTAARAAVAQAAPQEERYRILLEKGHTTRPLYENALKALQSAEAQVQAAEANLRIARNQLGYTELRAPDDGIVTATLADPGQVVSAGQAVIEISRSSEREAVFAVASDHIGKARLGLQVKVWVQGRPETGVVGSVRQISPEADGTTGTYQVKVALPSPPPEMRLGAIVVGRAESADGPEIVSLPSTALLQSGESPQVWVVQDDGTVRRRAVQIFEFGTDTVALSQGLSAGERVVTAGVNSLADGQRVRPEPDGKPLPTPVPATGTLKAAMETTR